MLAKCEITLVSMTYWKLAPLLMYFAKICLNIYLTTKSNLSQKRKPQDESKPLSKLLCSETLEKPFDRFLAADGDLVAAEARYHWKCSCIFHKHSESNDDRSHCEVDTAMLKTFENNLSELSAKSRTTKAWTELVIKPTLLIMQSTRATHGPDYALLTATMNKMLPCFSAAHKHSYARDELFFCLSLTYLPNEVEQQFLRGEHILHHSDGLWNDIP